MPSRRVVVGVGDSAAGLAAARWGAAEAAHRRAQLHLLRVQTCNPSIAALAAACACAECTDPDWAAELVFRTVGAVRTVAPHLSVTGQVVYGNVVACLLAAGCQSQLLVLGSHSVLSRSFARSRSRLALVASKSPVPVVVVEPSLAGTDPAPAETGLIVVLTYATTGIDRLVDYGCAQAERRHASVHVITVVKPPRHGEDVRIAAELELFDSLRRCRGRWPAAHLAGHVTDAKTDGELRSLLSRAQLLVVNAQHARSLLRRRTLSVPFGIRSGPGAVTVLPF